MKKLGATGIARLTEMLHGAAFAFLTMTAEDQQPDGTLRAWENVFHEIGLFQGSLGFERAIVLLENGHEEFSNIQGLGQEVRFQRKISERNLKISALLERESKGLLENVVDVRCILDLCDQLEEQGSHSKASRASARQDDAVNSARINLTAASNRSDA